MLTVGGNMGILQMRVMETTQADTIGLNCRRANGS